MPVQITCSTYKKNIENYIILMGFQKAFKTLRIIKFLDTLQLFKSIVKS